MCLADWAVGRLVKAIAERGRQGNTLVIVTSDNGAPHRPNGDWRGQKGDLWDGGHREPFVAAWPGHIPAGAVLDAPLRLTDVLPTVAAAAGLSAGAEDGRNQLPALISGQGEPMRAIVHHSLGGRFAIRHGRWKAIFAPGSGGGFSEPSISNLLASGSGKAHANPVWDKENPRGQLYDVASDQYKAHDLRDAQPAMEICVDESSGLPFGVPR